MLATADDTGVPDVNDAKIEARSAEIFEDLMTVPETAAVLKVNRATVFRLMKVGDLPRVRFLKRTYVPVPELIKLRDAEIERARKEAAALARKKTPRPRRAS
ncbi:helix-turn-helix domain-containing protein [Amycolatopsis dendrobii]|uniref:Helix-turn-helix domain-containing protein n=1 Tax=Amycolatopsis dendrobii TaxID=2760662 RepID=A0A7W3VUW9_9PSEU|nr:helix-turn-helix domain-containing protein [Amycolatopsis dendrobii]MBB1153454.1 helix-turn-helix domain-containing protein [Amycolatopsis dendrobii]